MSDVFAGAVQSRPPWGSGPLLKYRITGRYNSHMADEKKETWITWLALTTAFLAVFAAVTTMYMGKYSNRAILIQGQETDQWAYYQAKSIKGHTYEIQKQKLELEFLSLQVKMHASVADKYKKTITDYEANIKRYEKEKSEIKAGAEKLAGQKGLLQNMSANLSYSLIFLQIAIVMSSVAAITKKKPLWYLGLATVSGWVFYFSNAFLLFF
jgi:hypothetical protein